MRIEIDDVLDWHPAQFTPFLLKLRSAATSEMIFGGPAPDGVLPRVQLPGSYYLMTIPLNSDRDLSLFSTVSDDDALDPLFHAGEILGEESPIVQLVEHGRRIPRLGANRIATITPQPLGCEFGLPGRGPMINAMQDLIDFYDQISDEHRLGGPPKYYQLKGVADECIELGRNGFGHVLRLCCMDYNDDRFPHTFPFGEYVFHLFVRKTSSRYEYRVIWS
jgi:hypothetical protein